VGEDDSAWNRPPMPYTTVIPTDSAGSLATKEEWENVPSVAGFPKGVAQTVVAVATVCCSPPRERWECVGFKMRSPERRPRTRGFRVAG